MPQSACYFRNNSLRNYKLTLLGLKLIGTRKLLVIRSIERWLLLRGCFTLKSLQFQSRPELLAVIIIVCGCYSEVVVNLRCIRDWDL